MEGRCSVFSSWRIYLLIKILQIYTFAWIFGFTFSLLSYYGICRYISPITNALVEEAVLPPQIGDGSSSDQDIYERKDGLQTHTKEVEVA